MIMLDYKSGVPICNQVVNGFIRLRALGAIAPGEQLPSVRALASKLSVNPNTIAKAYSILEERGVIFSIKGKGSFISDETDSVINATKNEFLKALDAATSLGLSKEDILTLTEEFFKEEKND